MDETTDLQALLQGQLALNTPTARERRKARLERNLAHVRDHEQLLAQLPPSEEHEEPKPAATKRTKLADPTPHPREAQDSEQALRGQPEEEAPGGIKHKASKARPNRANRAEPTPTDVAE